MTGARLVVCVNNRLGAGQKSCAASGSRDLIDIFRQRITDSGIDASVEEQVCLGRCAEGIAMRIAHGGPFFTQVIEADVDLILHSILIFSKKFT